MIRRLQAYDFPNNIRELETLIDRALRQIRRQESNVPALIPEDVFWTPPNSATASTFGVGSLNCGSGCGLHGSGTLCSLAWSAGFLFW